MSEKLGEDFFHRDALIVARELAGKIVVRKFENGEARKIRITETEAYCGEEDKGCHASKDEHREQNFFTAGQE